MVFISVSDCNEILYESLVLENRYSSGPTIYDGNTKFQCEFTIAQGSRKTTLALLTVLTGSYSEIYLACNLNDNRWNFMRSFGVADVSTFRLDPPYKLYHNCPVNLISS